MLGCRLISGVLSHQRVVKRLYKHTSEPACSHVTSQDVFHLSQSIISEIHVLHHGQLAWHYTQVILITLMLLKIINNNISVNKMLILHSNTQKINFTCEIHHRHWFYGFFFEHVTFTCNTCNH